MTNEELRLRTEMARRCGESGGRSWHCFGNDKLEEGKICECGKAIVKNGIVTRIN